MSCFRCDNGWVTEIEPYPWARVGPSPHKVIGHFPLGEVAPGVEVEQVKSVLCPAPRHRANTPCCVVWFMGMSHEAADACPHCKPNWAGPGKRKDEPEPVDRREAALRRPYKDDD